MFERNQNVTSKPL